MDDISDENNSNAAKAVASQNKNTRKKKEKKVIQIFPIEEIEEMMEGIQSTDHSKRKEAITKFRRILSNEQAPPTDQVIKAGAIPFFVKLLKDEDWEIQFEATWALTNVVSGTSAHTRAVLETGAVPVLIELLNSEHIEVCEQAVWTLGNIAGDSVKCRDFVLDKGALPAVLKLFDHTFKIPLYKNAVWTLSNLVRGKPQVPLTVVAPALPILASLLDLGNLDVLTDACWALSYISDGPPDRIHAVLEAGVARRLVDLLDHSDENVQTAALRNVGNIATGDDLQTQLLINVGGIEMLSKLLSKTSIKSISREAIWVFSNITAGNRVQIQKVIDAGVIEQLVRTAQTADIDIRRECLWALANPTSAGNDAQIAYLVRAGCVGFLCDMLSARDERMLSTAMEGLVNILQVGAKQERNIYLESIYEVDGVNKIRPLLEHGNPHVKEQATQIIAFFGTSEHA
eukprot:Phypoly_transcript_09397.p1 GENE.Phypoly_transcript_09397~~Phypoly_transcript_09397.p1  ORF type:complete len:458 (+),score=83.23 Phypoly_transcript_09397:32-1405(+)